MVKFAWNATRVDIRVSSGVKRFARRKLDRKAGAPPAHRRRGRDAMRLPRRRFLQLAAVAALPAAARRASAETWPARPVRIVVGFPAGNAPDIVARLIGQWLSERLSQQFVVENRPGAGSTIATEGVV